MGFAALACPVGWGLRGTAGDGTGPMDLGGDLSGGMWGPEGEGFTATWPKSVNLSLSSIGDNSRRSLLFPSYASGSQKHFALAGPC